MGISKEAIDKMIEEYEDRIMILRGCISTLEIEKIKLETPSQ